MRFKFRREEVKVVEGFVFNIRSADVSPDDRSRERDGVPFCGRCCVADNGASGVLLLHSNGSCGGKRKEPKERKENSNGSNH